MKLNAVHWSVVSALLWSTGECLLRGNHTNLQVVSPIPRCVGRSEEYIWYATVQHCMDLGPDGSYCPRLNDTLFGLVYYAGNVVEPTVNLTKNVAAVKEKLALLPDGYRIVQAQNCHKIAEHPNDNILPKSNRCKNGTKFSGLWWDNGVKALAADNTAFMKAYKEAHGNVIDSVVLDPEISLDAWSLFLNTCAGGPEQEPCCLDKLDAIQNDHRFPAVLTKLETLGFKVDKSKPHWLHDAFIPYSDSDGGYTENLAVWEGFANTLTSEMYNNAVVSPIKAIYPNVNINNYGSMTNDQQHCLPDQSGFTPCRYAGGALSTIVGTQQAPCMYVWMQNASVAKGLWRTNQTAQGTPFALTGFNGLLMGVNLMRMNVLSSKFPVVPWVAYKNDTNMAPLTWLKPLANTEFYQEHILHLAMHNPPSMLYFNPCWAKGYCYVSWDDNLLFANLFHELTEMAGCTWQSRHWVPTGFAAWNTSIVMSGMAMPDGKTVWRVTTKDGKTGSHVRSVSGGIEIDVPGEKNPVIFQGGHNKGAGPNAPAGVWIETPTSAASPHFSQ
eukprot:m.10051 g.10051  ORF g.10051 m.10051 type:complete len:554 (-) comp7180_c0_seq1:309-1970(-)